MTKRIDVKLMGINVGTATGWDEAGDYILQFYDFVPSKDIHPAIGLQASGCLTFDPYQEGNLSSYDDDGEVEWTVPFSTFFQAMG